MIRALLALALALSACSEEPAREAPEPLERAEPPSREAPEPRTEEAPAPAAVAPAAPASGCAFGEPARVAPGAGWASVAASERAFFVAGSTLEGEAESAFVARVELDGTVRTLARAALEHPVPIAHRRAAPALAVSGGEVALALVDGARRVLLGEVRSNALAWKPIGSDGSLRFAPALAAVGARWAAAWTVEEGESLSVRGALVAAGEVTGARELRPEAGGSAAPQFVDAGALVFLDPRAGVSVAHRARVSERGFADPTVARPLNLVAEPPEIAVVRAGGREWIAYTAVGSAATTAVGLAPLDGTAPPVALVPGTGYGVLHVGAASLDDGRAIFVADAPQGAPTDAPRELHVRVLSSDGALTEPVVLRGAAGNASRGRIAHASDGIVAVSFTDSAGLHVAVGRCASGNR